MKNYLIVAFIVSLIIITSIVKTSTRNLEAKIFKNNEEIKLLSYKKDLILLEHNFLSSPEKLFELKKSFFDDILISLNLKKYIILENHEQK